MPRFLIEVREPQRSGGERERVELVEDGALHLIGELAGRERVDVIELGPQLTLSRGQREDGGERQRRGARAREKQAEL